MSGAARPFQFTALAFLGDPAPGGETFINDFEPYGLNARGDASFATDLPEGEGVFLRSGGQISQIIRSGAAAPGGGTFGPGVLGTISINEMGGVAFAFPLQPFDPTLPFGTNAGLYRFSPITGAVTPVVVPGITPMPGGGVVTGLDFDPGVNDGGQIVFTGLLPGGHGVFTVDGQGKISNVASPGDVAPGGTFDAADNPSLNNGGDVAFQGRLTGEVQFSVYLKRAATGAILSIVHVGDPMPGGGVFFDARGPVVNSRAQVAFVGNPTPTTSGIFLWSAGSVTAIARPGDAMPGGGNLLRVRRGGTQSLRLNDPGDIVFFGFLDTGQWGLFLSSRDALTLVAGTGTVIPGVGTVVAVGPGAMGLNELGQILFNADVSDASGNVRTALLLATPSPSP